jgi:hypothetical protein
MTGRGVRLFLLLAAACAPAARAPADPMEDVASEVPVGSFEDDYGERAFFGAGSVVQLPYGRLHVERWNIPEGYFVAQNDSTNKYDPGTWARVDFIRLTGMPPWEWAYCLSAYNAPTADSAEATRIARPDTPRTGCNGHPFTRLKRG